MRALRNRLIGLERTIVLRAHARPCEYTRKQIEAARTLCLTFEKHFGRPDSLTWDEEPKANDLQEGGRTWLKNLACIVAHLARHPDSAEKARALPELTGLTKLVTR